MQAPFHIPEAPHSLSAYGERQLAPEAPPSPPTGGGLLGQLAVMAAYLKEMELQSHLIQLKAMAVQLEAAAGEGRAIDVQNYAAELAAAANKAGWFLSATLA